MDLSAPIHVAGHQGLVGSAMVRALRDRGAENLILRTHAKLDLTEQAAVREFYRETRPRYVFLAAAKVGGIKANDTYPVEFLRDNLLIQTNILDAALREGCEKVLFLGSSCIYPKHAPQPIPEDALLTGPLEPTNQWYALAKISGLKLGQAMQVQYGLPVVSLMPTNLYGPGDNFDPEGSHVIPGLMRRFHEAKETGADKVVVWGTGSPLREFLHVDDLADASLFLMDNWESDEHVNVGTGEEVSIRQLAELLKDVTGFAGEIVFDDTKPDGTPRKLLDCSSLFGLGWRPSVSLEEGLRSTYEWYLNELGAGNIRG
ncbi:GDP-L-fucose synthase family protein [Desulfohalovibrio reitneri]|uniref:GDP-L-fucose synthase family protein n=1 Tax=Desulfohalovibrio reitneri TaxID=1307759 RepID=UPI0004A6FF30|nr:GDP-L-fucose synthase [Desulfohalovibrio reitneri]